MPSQLPETSTTNEFKSTPVVQNESYFPINSYKAIFQQLLKGFMILTSIVGAGVALRHIFMLLSGVNAENHDHHDQMDRSLVPWQHPFPPVLTQQPDFSIHQVRSEIEERQAMGLSVPTPPTPGPSITKKPVMVTGFEIGSLDTNGYANGVTLNPEGTLAFLADGSGFKIINVTNPSAPVLKGSLDMDYYGYGVTLNKDATLAFVADGDSGLKIIDVTNPSAPILQGSFPTSDARGVTLNPDATLAFVADREKGLKIINITNASAPVLKGSLNTYGYSYEVTLNPEATLAFVADYSKGLKIIDVTNPSAPVLKGNLDTDGYANGVTLNKEATLAFVADGEKGLKIINITNASAPVLKGSLNIGYANRVALNKDASLAFVPDGGGLKIIDVTNPSTPVLKGSLRTSGAYGVTLNPDATLTFVASSSGLKIIKVLTFYSPSITRWNLAGNLDTDGYANGVTLNPEATLAFVADGLSGLEIINVTNSSAPVLKGSLDTDGYAKGVTLNKEATLAFVADYSNGLKIIDVTNPSAPVLKGSLDTDGYANGVTLNKEATLAFVADDEKGLKIINITNASAPVLKGSLNIGYANRVALNKDASLAFVVGGSSGLKIINVTNASAPILQGSLYSDDYTYGVTLNPEGTLAFVTDGGKGLKIIDVTNPFVPILTGAFYTYNAHGVTLNKDATLAFVADYSKGLKIIDVTNPSAPVLKGSLYTDGLARGVALNKDATLAFVASSSGLKIIKLESNYFTSVIFASGEVVNLGETVATLKVGITNSGQILFLSPTGVTKLGVANFSAVNQVIPPGEQDVPPPWFSFSKTTQKFSAVPPKEWTGQRLIINTQITDGAMTDEVWSYFYIEPSLIIDTASIKLSIQSPASIASLSLQLSNPSTGKFVLQPFGAVSMSFNPITGRLDSIGTVTGLNAMFQVLRFSCRNLALKNTTTVSMTVDDTINVPQSTTITLDKFNANIAPNVTMPFLNQTFKMGISVNFEIPFGTFTDADGDTLTYTAKQINGTTLIDLPSWLAFNPTQGRFTGTTPYKNEIIPIDIIASDGYLQTSASFYLQINNQGPFQKIPIPVRNASIGKFFDFTISSGTFVDNDDPDSTLKYTATGFNKTDLPGWLTFDSDRRRLYGTPTLPSSALKNISYSEIVPIELVVTDSAKLSGTGGFNISVKDAVPFVNKLISNSSAKMGEDIVIEIPFNTFTDADGDTLTYTAQQINGTTLIDLPSWLAFNPTQGRFTGTTPYKNEIIPIDIIASDGYLQTSASFYLQINNQGPFQRITIPVQNASIGKLFDFTISSGIFVDNDDPDSTLKYTATGFNKTNLPGWLTFDSDRRRFYGTPTLPSNALRTVSYSEIVPVALVVTDSGKLSGTGGFNISVKDAVPFQNMIIPVQNASIGKFFDFTIPSGTFVDIDDPDSTLKYTATGPSWLTFDSDRRRFYGTPVLPSNALRTVSYSEIVPVELVVTDSAKLSGTGGFNISVKNAVPLVLHNITTYSVKPGKSFIPFSIPMDTFWDPENSQLTYSVKLSNGSRFPDWLIFNPNTRQFSGIAPSTNQAVNIIVTASDSAGLYVDTPFLFVIENTVPIAPVLLPFKTKAMLAFDLQLNQSAFSDLNNDPLTISVSSIQNMNGTNVNLPWLTFNRQTWQFFGTAPLDTIGMTYQVILEVSDGTTLVNTKWILEVRNNQAPLWIKPFPMQVATTNDLYRFQIPSDFFLDPNNDTLSYFAVESGKVGLPAWLDFDTTTRVLSGKPTVGNLGTYPIQITVKDEFGASNTTTLTLEVVRSWLDLLAFISAVVGPILTGLATAYTVYEKYPSLWNAFARSRYHWEEIPEDFLNGQPYTPQWKNGDIIPTDEIKQVKLVKTTEAEGIHKQLKRVMPDGLFHNLTHDPVPAAQDTLPTWLTYNHETNKLQFLRDNIPADIRGKYTLKVLGDNHKILQQIDLDIGKILTLFSVGAYVVNHEDTDLSILGQNGVDGVADEVELRVVDDMSEIISEVSNPLNDIVNPAATPAAEGEGGGGASSGNPQNTHSETTGISVNMENMKQKKPGINEHRLFRQPRNDAPLLEADALTQLWAKIELDRQEEQSVSSNPLL